MTRSRSRPRLALAAILAIGLLATLAPAASAAAPSGCANRTNNTLEKLLTCVTLDGVRGHQAALQAIADANGNDRAAGQPGYQASVDYVAGQLRSAGYTVTLDPFEFTYSVGFLEQLTPTRAEYESGPFTGTGEATMTGTVIPVDLALAPPRATTSGCEASDFAGLNFGGTSDIALIQRGTCSFAAKALNAQAAGAEAVIIFDQGNDPTREGLIVGTLAPSTVAIPVVGASFASGVALSQPGSTAKVMTLIEDRTDHNILAELPGRTSNNVVMAGAHLDSVQTGTGINDNGSGSAAILETALRMAKVKPENTVRFAWWGAEEGGLIGSTKYVAGLSQDERDRIALYLNFDMVGSPNYVFGIYDADKSSFPAPAGVPIPAGSVAIEHLFESFYTSRNEPYDDSAFSGRSDYQAFILNGIPSGGLFTGAETVKTARQQSIWGGTTGAQFDPCYHQACDTYDNVSLHALDINSDAIAYAIMTFAYSTESVNGVKGKPVPGGQSLPAPAGPQGTFATGGGGLHHDHDHKGEES